MTRNDKHTNKAGSNFPRRYHEWKKSNNLHGDLLQAYVARSQEVPNDF